MLNKNHTVIPVLLPFDYGVKDASLIWNSSDESVLKVADGVIEPVGNGSAIVTVSHKSNPEIQSVITVNVANIVIKSFVDVGSNLVRGSVFFEKDKEIEVIGVNPSSFEKAYNRDFMSYDSETNKLTYIGETGTWDVFYSSTYNYFWVARMNDVAPDCYWIVGEGFASPSEWHNDFLSGGWSTSNMRQMAYMRLLGNGVYQATINMLSPFSFVTYANRAWSGQLYGSTLTAPTGIGLHPANNSDIISLDGFEPGYYRFTFDKPNMTYHFEKVN